MIVKKKTTAPLTTHQKLLEDIEKTRLHMDTIYRNFQYVSDPDLIDCYIYEMNCTNLRYRYLIKQLRTMQKEPVKV